jgi:hypothetical protein
LVTIHLTDGVASLSRHYLHVEHEVFVYYQKHWHVCNRLDDTFSPCPLAVAVASLHKGRFCAGTVHPWVATRQRVWSPGVPVRRFTLLCLFPREEHLFPKKKAVGRGLILQASTQPSRSPYCSGLLYECVCVTPSFLPSPRPTGSTLSSHLRSTSLWSAFRPSLKVCWLYLIPVKSAVLQATTSPCLHFKLLDLLSRSLMFGFVRAQEDFLF